MLGPDLYLSVSFFIDIIVECVITSMHQRARIVATTMSLIPRLCSRDKRIEPSHGNELGHNGFTLPHLITKQATSKPSRSGSPGETFSNSVFHMNITSRSFSTLNTASFHNNWWEQHHRTEGTSQIRKERGSNGLPHNSGKNRFFL